MRKVGNRIFKFDHFIKLCGCSMRADCKAKSSNDFSYPVIKNHYFQITKDALISEREKL